MMLIVESQYFVNIDVIKKLIKYKHITFERCENFQKNSFRNRCIILSSNGLQALTVPIMGGREQKTSINTVKIDNSQNWQNDHWKGLVSAYNKSSFFEYYETAVKNLIYSDNELLWDLNIEIFNWVVKILNIEVEINFTEKFEKEHISQLDFRNKILPKNFQLEKLGWKPEYFQVFSDRHGFQPNLSILDLIFNEGPNAKNLLVDSIV